MRYLKVPGLVVFFLLSMSGTATSETHGKADGCLLTLYNYPAETPQYNVSEQVSPQLPVSPKKNLRASKTDEKNHSRINLASQGHTKK